MNNNTEDVLNITTPEVSYCHKPLRVTYMVILYL